MFAPVQIRYMALMRDTELARMFWKNHMNTNSHEPVIVDITHLNLLNSLPVVCIILQI